MSILVLALLLDLVLGEFFPARLHPVAWMGKLIQLLQGLAPGMGHGDHPNPQDQKALSQGGSRGWNFPALIFGAALAILIPGAFASATYFAFEGLRSLSGIGYILVGALVLKSTFAVRMLEEGRLDDARAGLKSLVSRDTSGLTPELATAAAVELVAENTTDSFVAPWLAFALFGPPGAVAYRAINTLDSMLGYHGVYEYLGKASARLDDLVNLVPARLCALLIVAGGVSHPQGWSREAKNGWRVMWRDHAKTESPNAGWTMSSMAGALGVQLEKVGHYRIGDGGTTHLVPKDIKRAKERMYFVIFAGFFLALGITLARHTVL